jgi:hypothetical protein
MQSVNSRYSDAYIVAQTLESIGAAVKYAGLGIGSLMFFGAVVSIQMSPLFMPHSLGPGRFVAAVAGGLAGIGVAGVVGTMLFLIGTLTAAQGQMLKATLDTAVNTSVLSDDERARNLSMPPAATALRIPIATASETSNLR